jgi:hypothetical protein
MALRVFLSYRRDDSAGHAGRVHDRLQREFGRNLLFMDVDSIPLGANFTKVLSDEIAKCDTLLAVIGPGWLDARDEHGNRRLDNPDDFVRIEIGTALKRDIPVIPILLEGTGVPKAEQLPNDLKELALRNGLDVRHVSFDDDMKRLIRGLKNGQPPQRPVPAAPPREDGRRASSRLRMPVWNFFRNDKNRAVLGWIGGGVVAIIGALWAVFVYLVPPSKSGPPPASVEARCGGVAVGGNVSGSTINAGGVTGADCAPKPK